MKTEYDADVAVLYPNTGRTGTVKKQTGENKSFLPVNFLPKIKFCSIVFYNLIFYNVIKEKNETNETN